MLSRPLCALAFLAGASSVAAFAQSYPAHPNTVPEITAQDLSARDKAISDDAFQGRGPGTAAGEAAAAWLADEMKRIGLKPGNHGSYFQPVPAVNITLDASKSNLSFTTSQGALTPKFPGDVVYWTARYKSPDVHVKDAPLVFVGYGVVAPEYNWNDYAGVDVKGKTVVILINDPGNEDANPDPKFFKGKAMTYYGRWTYKYEEAARQGAAAAIIVHETVPAAYGWEVVRNSNSGAKSWLDVPNRNMNRAAIEGWVTLDTAKELFKRAGLDYASLKAAADKPGFKAVPMTGESLSADAHSTVTHIHTRNVVGVIPGSKHPDQYVLYTAHWDHLGVKPDVPGPDKIYNGAVDNGMGVSSIFEIAEKFENDKPHPQRSVAIICWTMEEQGLLGSQYFAEHPIWPLSHIVAGINLDANLPVITADPESEKGYFYRSDHISLAKVGVPMLYPGGGYDLVDGGTAAGKALRDDYRIHHYHQPSDEYNPSWDLSGPVQDLDALYTLGDEIANSDQWPNWYKDNEFRATRDRTMGGKS